MPDDSPFFIAGPRLFIQMYSAVAAEVREALGLPTVRSNSAEATDRSREP